MTSLELRAAIRAKFAWPGGYAIFGIADDGEALCCKCMRQEYRQIAYARRNSLRNGWRVVAVTCTANEENVEACAHCNAPIE